MFHFDPEDYLCPLYLCRKGSESYNSSSSIIKIGNNVPKNKVSATSV